jgi:hypothetical protein
LLDYYRKVGLVALEVIDGISRGPQRSGDFVPLLTAFVLEITHLAAHSFIHHPGRQTLVVVRLRKRKEEEANDTKFIDCSLKKKREKERERQRERAREEVKNGWRKKLWW